MLSINRTILLSCLRQIARGLIKFCLKHSIKVQELEECLRSLYLELASEEILRKDNKVSDSRLSIITGLSRREVQRISRDYSNLKTPTALIMKVVGLWQSNVKFLDREKQPKLLSYGFEESSFNKLVNMVSKDLNPATVLFELERVGAVERTGETLRLNFKTYQPRGDVKAGFGILGEDIVDLVDSVEENVFYQPNLANLHIRTEYDRIRQEGINELKSWLLKEGSAFHARAREKFAKFDQDINPDPSYTGKFNRIVLASFGKVDEEDMSCK